MNANKLTAANHGKISYVLEVFIMDLSAEVFSRSECPDWARSAYIDHTGVGWYCNMPKDDIMTYGNFWGAKNAAQEADFRKMMIPQCRYATSWHAYAVYDSSDWKNSAIDNQDCN